MGAGPRIFTAMLIGALSLTSSVASAFVVKHASSGALVRWNDKSVDLVIDSSVDEVPGANDALASAITAWSGKGGAPALTVAQREGSLSPGFDGKNVVFYNKAGFEPVSGEALAVTILTFDSDTGQVLDADIVMNGKYPLGVVDASDAGLSTKTAGSKDVVYDVRRVMAHEMGHALGLGDELGKDTSLMYPYVPSDTTLLAKPASDDVDGLSTIYADAPAAADDAPKTGGCNVGGAGTSGLGLFGVGLLGGAALLARSRKKRGVAGVFLAAGLVTGSAEASSSVMSVTAHRSSDIVVTARHLSTTAVNGLFTTDVEACGEAGCFHVKLWGGQIGHVQQVIGGAEVPAEGQRFHLKARADD